ncbi:MAG: hypothetical protein EHM24_33140 [Acidobacteria bacterium]|nr:MAG: hypothetical protein EHM24_33140 [Acidobacteriota bacterium]
MHTFGPWSHDPGPCPVDDTPHTACTPESVARLRVPLASTPAHARAAQLVAERAAAVVPSPEPPPPVPFTTQTYRRATHGRKRGPRAGD